MADPPWKFGDSLPGAGRGAGKHYPCMTVAELEAFALPPLAPDCLLLLWRVAAMQPEALFVAKAWGFTIKSEIVWRKLTKRGKQHFGMGRYTRAAHEICLIGVRDEAKPKIADHSIPSVFDAPIGKHSEKPDAIYRIAERLVPKGPHVELFARRARPGWFALGNEAT